MFMVLLNIFYFIFSLSKFSLKSDPYKKSYPHFSSLLQLSECFYNLATKLETVLATVYYLVTELATILTREAKIVMKIVMRTIL